MLTQVAVPVQVYALTRSSLDVGLVGLAGLVPIVVLGLYGGAVADVIDRRKLYLWSSLAAWLITLALLAQTLLAVGSVGLILALVFVQSGAFAISSSARGAIIPRIVEPELVAAANTLAFTVSNIGQVLGPLIAGGLIALDNGYAYAYAADAVLFTAALYSALRLPTIPPGEGAGRALGLRSVLDGLAFIATRPVLIMSFAVDIAAMVLAMPRALFPAMADARFHGAVAIAGLAPQLWLVVLLLAAAGAADLVSAVYRQTILQTYAPDEMRGRMQGVFIAVVAGGPRLGDVRAGATAAVTGATVSWVAGGIACVVVVLVSALLVRSFWTYDASAASGDVR